VRGCSEDGLLLAVVLLVRAGLPCTAGRLATTLLRGRLPEHVLVSTASVWGILVNVTLTVTDIRTGLASACTLPQYVAAVF
jgi:hypothetical protein